MSAAHTPLHLTHSTYKNIIRRTVPRTVHKTRSVIDEFAKRLPKAVDETPFTVFICGPTPSSKSSAILGRYVSDEIERRIGGGVTVVWGEHRDFLSKVGNIVLRRFNDVTKELDFAMHSDLLLIFPDSPGSFVELGIFGMHPKVCPQPVVVFDKRYKNGTSFAVNAMGKAAGNLSATIKFLGYGDRAATLRRIEIMVRKRQESKYNALCYSSH